MRSKFRPHARGGLVVTLTTESLHVHEAANLVPAMRPEEWAAFLADVRENGIREPIVVQAPDTILDGRHRWIAATECGLREIPARLVALEPAEQERYVIAAALLRRHLNDDQRAMLALKWQRRASAQAQSEAGKRANEVRWHGSDSDTVSESDEKRDIRAEAADLFRVPERRLRYAAEIERRSPELAEQVESGEKSLLQARREARALAQAELQQAPLPTGKYRVIYADPPWRYGNMMPEYAPAQDDHYPTMALEQICALPVADLAEDNAVLFLWATSPILEESFQVVNAWGFKYKAAFVWDKVKHNMGHYNSVRHELLLICTRGSCQPDNRRLFDSVQTIERTEHSRKPEFFREIIDTLYPYGRRLELFARGDAHPNWEAYGNEVRVP